MSPIIHAINTHSLSIRSNILHGRVGAFILLLGRVGHDGDVLAENERPR